MSSAKLAIACGFAAVVLSACGAKSNPPAGSVSPTATTAGRAKLDDPRDKPLPCLRETKLPVAKVGKEWLQIGTPPSGPRVRYVSTPGAAQWVQIDGQEPGAEAIGNALLYPDRASDHLLSKVETCLSDGVKG